jgi:hypothetical protein
MPFLLLAYVHYKVVYYYIIYYCKDPLCGLVARVPSYRSRDPGSISGTTGFSEKSWPTPYIYINPQFINTPSLVMQFRYEKQMLFTLKGIQNT